MRLSRFVNPISALLHVTAVLAVAGIVHILTIFEAPKRAPRDAFTRLAAVSPSNAMVGLQTASSSANAIPFRDPAMLSAVCRFDLSAGPLQVTLDPIDHGFLAIGMHSRRGLAFYGLNVRSSEHSRIALTLLTAAQKADDDSDGGSDQPARDLRVLAPEPQGFILVDTPAGEGGGIDLAQDNLRHVHCGAQPDKGSPTPP